MSVRRGMDERIAGAEPTKLCLHREAATAAAVTVTSASVDVEDFNGVEREFIRGIEFSDPMSCRCAL